MNTPPEQPFEVYLDQVLAQLRSLPPERRAAVADELRAHLHDAAADAGRDATNPDVQAEVIRTLGSPHRMGRALARVYGVDARGRRSGRLWLAWVAVAAGGWPLGALVGLASPTPGADTALLAIPLGGIVVAVMQLLVLRRVLPGALRDAATPALFCGGWLLGALVIALTPFRTFWEPVMESLLLVVPLAVGLLVGTLQQVALRRVVGPVHLWPGATGIGLLAGCILALVAGNAAWTAGLGNMGSAVAGLCVLGGTQAAVTGLVLVRAMAGGGTLRGLAGGGTLAEAAPSLPGSPLVGHLATAFAALPVLLICGGLILGQPAIRPDTTAEITTSAVAVSSLGGARVGVSLPGRAATLYVHEDHRQVFRRDALVGAPPEEPITVRVYRGDLDRLDLPVRVRALEIRSAERVYLPLEAVAAGRNAAEPLLLAGAVGALLVILRALVATLRRLLLRAS